MGQALQSRDIERQRQDSPQAVHSISEEQQGRTALPQAALAAQDRAVEGLPQSQQQCVVRLS